MQEGDDDRKVSVFRTAAAAAGLLSTRFPFINKIDAKYDFSFRYERVTNSSTHTAF